MKNTHRTRRSHTSPKNIQSATLRNVAFIIFLCLNSWLFSTTLTIKLDGTGDFTTIQPGIDASADGDTVLVHPGIYYENLNMNGKNITLASLELTTGNPQYINQTVIDGQRSGSCITVHSGETDPIIQGFTLTNGYGSQHWSRDGGGVQIYDNSSVIISNCVFEDNIANAGGALYARHGSVHLSGVVIKNNCGSIGGGIYVNDDSIVEFDSQNLCSVYNNNAGRGSDLYFEDSGFVNVVVDTFTVVSPPRYYLEYYGTSTCSISIQQGWMELVSHDLYVAPDGDNANSGFSADDPLQTVAWAVRKIHADSLHPRTVYVASGTYSNALNNQQFPIGCKEYVSIIGDSINIPTIMTDMLGGLIVGKFVDGSIELSNLDLKCSPDLDSFSLLSLYDCYALVMNNVRIVNNSNIFIISSLENISLEIDNFVITGNTVNGHNASLGLNNARGYLKNSRISNNTSTQASPYEPEIAMQLMAWDDFLIQNCVFSENYYDDFEGHMIRVTNHNANEPVITFENCLFADNETESPSIVESYNHDGLTQFNNCTFTNNTAGWFTIYSLSDITMRNTIMDNNTFYEIMMEDDTINNHIYELDVDYCNIRNGEAGIANNHGVNTIIWGEHNIEDDPGFALTGEHPYQLAAGSPCIDAGIPDTTGMFLPPWDLLQNHRVWDGNGNGQARVDMGCYEYGAGPWVYAQPPVVPSGEYVVCNYPNPFKPSVGRGPATVISFSVPDAGEVELVIYNMRGQKVRTLMKCYSAPGSYKAQWDGRDGNHQPVASGIYFAQLITPQRTTAHKMMLLK